MSDYLYELFFVCYNKITQCKPVLKWKQFQFQFHSGANGFHQSPLCGRSQVLWLTSVWHKSQTQRPKKNQQNPQDRNKALIRSCWQRSATSNKTRDDTHSWTSERCHFFVSRLNERGWVSLAQDKKNWERGFSAKVFPLAPLTLRLSRVLLSLWSPEWCLCLTHTHIHTETHTHTHAHRKPLTLWASVCLSELIALIAGLC